MTRAALLILMAFVPLTSAQEPAPATARIEGIVVDGATDAPLPAVGVAIRGTETRTATDHAGRFLLDRLPAGAHVLMTEKPGYMPARPDGVWLPGTAGVFVHVDGGGRVHVRMRMYPAGAVTGRVLDDRGRPWHGALVVPFRYGYADDGTEMVRTFSGARTNDLGEFRLTGLDAGHYFFRVTVESWRFPGGAEGGDRFFDLVDADASGRYPESMRLAADPLTRRPARDQQQASGIPGKS